MEQIQRNTYYDTIKYFLFILVVLIHNPLPNVIGEYLTAISRCAVPVFFCISGYFYKGEQQTRKNVYKAIKYMSIFVGMNIFWFILNYLIIKTPFAELTKWAKMELSFKNIATCLLFGEAYGNQYLWYLHAIAMVYMSIVVIESLGLKEFFCKISLLWVICFWILVEGIVIFFGRGIPVYLYRNWLAEGIGFFYMGIFLRKKTIKISNMLCGSLIVFGVCITIAEHYILGRMEFYFGSFVMVLGVMLLGKSLQLKDNCLAYFGEKYSLHLYLWHPLVAFIWILFQMIVFDGVEQYSIITTGMVIFLTTIIVSINDKRCLWKLSNNKYQCEIERK